jgi:hypothetical protein
MQEEATTSATVVRIICGGQGNEEYGLPGNDPNGVTPPPGDP